MIKLGEKIKTLRKQKNISQEGLANYLGVTFQAVSKWETEAALPDVALIPAIASFFGVSTDELFDFDVYRIEKDVEQIVEAHRNCWDDKEACEKLLRDGLKKYPGNDVLLNCLIGVIPVPERASEVIELCKSLIAGTRLDEVRFDACRIMAEAYHSIGESALAKDAIGKIPELYFTKLGVAAALLEGEDRFEAAVKQKSLALEDLLDMLEILADHYAALGETDHARIQLEEARQILLAVRDDFPTRYTRSMYEAFSDRLPGIEEKIARCRQT